MATNLQPDFVAYINDDATESVINQLINQYWPRGLVIHGGVNAALRANTQLTGVPQFVVVDISTSMNVEQEVQHLLSLYSTSKAILFIGDRNDIGFYRQVLKAGASDYLVKPIVSDEVYTSIINTSLSKIDTTTVATPSLAARGKSKLISIIGAHGGVGTSSMVVNLGWILAEERMRHTALIDLDVHFGTIALSLDVEPSIGFRDALESPSRIDTTFVEGTLVKATQRLSVLATEENLDIYIAFNNAAIELLLEKLKEIRDFIIIDAPRSTLVRAQQVITQADVVCIVTELTVAGLRDTVTILSKLRSFAPEKDIRIIVNKDRTKKTGQIAIKDFESELEHKVFAVLPDAPEVAAASMNDGKPMSVVAGTSKIVEGLRHLAASLDEHIPNQQTGKKSGVVGKLLGKFK
jgi:pilus assembly protein CpaE